MVNDLDWESITFFQGISTEMIWKKHYDRHFKEPPSIVNLRCLNIDKIKSWRSKYFERHFIQLLHALSNTTAHGNRLILIFKLIFAFQLSPN